MVAANNNGIEDQEKQKRLPGGPWTKGVSGNPGGRPPGIPSLVAELRREAMREIKSKGSDSVREQVQSLARKVFARARAGDSRAAEMIRDALDGRPLQTIARQVRYEFAPIEVAPGGRIGAVISDESCEQH